ncbi:MAG TPA: hypothetical protein VJN02_10875 [Gammaproteobacteria bacterium]|nr:hypothetical protein [Gammaproteobacteria bacterium]
MFTTKPDNHNEAADENSQLVVDEQATADLSRLEIQAIPVVKLRLIKGGAFILGFSAGVPYFSPASKAAGEYIGLGYTFGVSTVVVFGITSSWGWYQTFKEVADRYYKNEPVSKYLILKLPAAFLLAGGSAVVTFYTVNRYNTSILYPILSISNNFGLDWSGYYKLVSYCAPDRPTNDRTPLLNANNCGFKILKKSILIIPLINLTLNAYLSYQSAESIVNSIPVGVIFVILTAVPAMGLDIFGSLELVDDVCGKRAERLEQSCCQYSAKLILKLSILPLSIFASTSRGFIAIDNFGKNVFGYIMAPLLIATGTVFGQYVLREVIDTFISLISSNRSTSNIEIMEDDTRTDDLEVERSDDIYMCDAANEHSVSDKLDSFFYQRKINKQQVFHTKVDESVNKVALQQAANTEDSRTRWCTVV